MVTGTSVSRWLPVLLSVDGYRYFCQWMVTSTSVTGWLPVLLSVDGYQYFCHA